MGACLPKQLSQGIDQCQVIRKMLEFSYVMTPLKCKSDRREFYSLIVAISLNGDKAMRGLGESSYYETQLRSPNYKPDGLLESCKNQFVDILRSGKLKSQNQAKQVWEQTVFEGIDRTVYFKQFCKEANQIVYEALLMVLVLANKLGKQRQNRPFVNALSFAVFDLWGKITRRSVRDIVFGQSRTPPPSFGTVLLNESIKMQVKANECMINTQNLRFCFDENNRTAITLLREIYTSSIVDSIGLNFQRRLTPQIWEQYIGAMKTGSVIGTSLYDKIKFVESPFSLQVSEEQLAKWKRLKAISGFKYFSREADLTEHGLKRFSQFFHGVILQLEEVGGPIEAIRVANIAKKIGLEVAIYSGPSTKIACSSAAHMDQIAEFLIIDGFLGIERGPFDVLGGQFWLKQRNLNLEQTGLGVEMKGEIGFQQFEKHL